MLRLNRISLLADVHGTISLLATNYNSRSIDNKLKKKKFCTKRYIGKMKDLSQNTVVSAAEIEISNGSR